MAQASYRLKNLFMSDFVVKLEVIFLMISHDSLLGVQEECTSRHWAVVAQVVLALQGRQAPD